MKNLLTLSRFLTGVSICNALPSRQPKSLLRVLSRAFSSDPSCPQDLLCEKDRRDCPVAAKCPSGEDCVDFGGVQACAPAERGLVWCAIAPDTFQAVGCAGGRCCHGQCYALDAVCCVNDNVQCILGSPCNVCAAGGMCGSDRCFSGGGTTLSTSHLPSTTNTGTTIPGTNSVTTETITTNTGTATSGTATARPTAPASVDAFRLLGCFVDSQSNRVLQNGTLVASTMTAAVCVAFASRGGWQYAGTENGNECYVGNDVVNRAEATGCDKPCAGAATQELCGGDLRVNLYRDTTWLPPGKDALEAALLDLLHFLQQLQESVGDWFDLVTQYNAESTPSNNAAKRATSVGLITLPQIHAARTTALELRSALRNAASTVQRRLASARTSHVVTEGEYIQMNDMESEIASTLDSTINTLSEATENAAGAVNPIAQGIVSFGAPELKVGTGVVLAAATGFFVKLLLFKVLIDAISTGGGTDPGTTTSTIVAPTKTMSTATSTSTDAPSVPTAYSVVFTKDMNKLVYNVVKASTVIGGGLILEDFADIGVDWYAFYAVLHDEQASIFLNTFPLTDCITHNDPAEDLDAGGTGDENLADDPDPDLTESIEIGNMMQLRNVNADHVGNRNFTTAGKRAVPPGPSILVVEVDSPTRFKSEGIDILPFHLQWLSNLWAKSELNGLFQDVPWYMVDRGVEARSIEVFVIDKSFKGFDTHQELSNIEVNSIDGTLLPLGAIDEATEPDDDHGTLCAAMVGGMSVGIDRMASLCLIKVDSIASMNRIIPEIIGYQEQNDNQPAIVSMSQGFKLPQEHLDNPKLQPGDPLKVDFGRMFAARMADAGIAVVSAAGNSGEEEPDSAVNTLTRFTPNLHGGTVTEMIVVGATDEGGQRASFSEYRDQNQGILSVYAIGTNVLVPFMSNRSNRRYRYKSGTSFAAPLTAGILSTLMSQDAGINAQNAKATLRTLAQSRKGEGWPVDLPGGVVVPRMATDLEVTCVVADDAQPDPLFTATWYNWSTRETASTLSIPTPDLLELPNYLQYEDTLKGCVSISGGNTILPVQSAVPQGL